MPHIMIRNTRSSDSLKISLLSEQLGYPSSSTEMKKRLEEISASNEHCVFVACRSTGAIVGWIHVFRTFRVESDKFCEIGGLVVDESSRKKGVGAKLVFAAKEWALQKGCSLLRVRSMRERKDAREFYSRMGFHLLKEQNVFEKMDN